MKTFAAFIAAMSLVSAVAAHATTDAGPATNGAWPAAGPARIRAERRTHGRMAFARRFRSSPPAGEHRVVFLHVARRIASEPGRRTRLRRYARTGRRADRDSRPARRRSSRTPLQSPGSAARFRPIHGGSASGPRRPASARRTVQEDLRLRESRPGLRGESRENSSDRPPASQGTSSRAHPVLARRRISAPQGVRSGPSRISARRPRRDRQRSADGGAAHPGESGRIGPLPAAKMLNPNTPTSFPSTSERMRQPPRRRRNEGGPKRRPEPTTGPARRRNAENFRISTMILRSRRRSDKQGLRSGGPAWPRRGAASALRGRIRNAENGIHASGFARGASNLKPSLDIPDRNCRTNGTLLGRAACRPDPASREPVQTVGRPLVESGRQRRARHRMPLRKHASARLPRLESSPRRSRPTKENGPHPSETLDRCGMRTRCSSTGSALILRERFRSEELTRFAE